MISLKKLKSLKSTTRLRKIARLFHDAEQRLQNNDLIDSYYYEECLQLAREDIPELPVPASHDALIWQLNKTRHAILSYLGIDTADWDFTYALDSFHKDTAETEPISIYLDQLRAPFNVGSIFRTAECFGVKEILLSPGCPNPEHQRVQRTAMKSSEIMPWKHTTVSSLETYDNIFALELGGTPVDAFNFPSNGVCILGSEELGVSQEALNAADMSLGRVSIPMYGRKGSLAVAVAAGIILYKWRQQLFAND